MEQWKIESSPGKQASLGWASTVSGLILAIGFFDFGGPALTHNLAGFLLGLLLLIVGVATLVMSGKRTVVVDPVARNIVIADSGRFGQNTRTISFDEVADVRVDEFGDDEGGSISYDVVIQLKDVKGISLFRGAVFDGLFNKSVMQERCDRIRGAIRTEGFISKKPAHDSSALSADVEVGSSPIEGQGLFVLRSFHPGERIKRINVVREITTETPLREDLGERMDHCDYPDGKMVLLGFPDRHINHSCDPNSYQKFEEGGSFFVARREIGVGEEITIDYNVNIAAGTAWPCNCGAKRCRGVVAGDFFLLPKEWQREYRPLLADWFVRRNRERVAALDLATQQERGG